MRIVGVEAVALSIPLAPLEPESAWGGGFRETVIVRVGTDAGLTGVGEAFAYGAPLGVAHAVEAYLRPLLIGEDPARIEYLTDRMHRATLIWGRRGLGMFAISGVEIALWDLLGQAHGLPVYALLGGAVRTRLPAYASLLRYATPEAVGAACRQQVERGFTWIKLHQTDVASVAAARAAVGPDVELMLDTNCPWSPGETIELARALAPYRLRWLEEPVWPPEDYAGLAEVRRSGLVPIATGECESTLYGFREIVRAGAADVLQPSVTKVGGIGECRKIAALAQAANLPLAFHSPYFGPGLAATLHLAAALTGVLPIELVACRHETPLLTRPIEASGGQVEVPTGPGLGVDLNEAVFDRYPYDPGRPTRLDSA